jgi:drug/metabolite transporter (DMT)-like permease
MANISITMIAFSSGTFFTALVEPIIYKRKISWNEVLIGLAIILVISYIGYGEYMKSLEENSLGNPSLGIIMGLIAAFTASLFSTFNGVLIKKNNAFSISFIELISANILLSIVMFFFFEVPDNLLSPSVEDLFWLLILGVVCTAFPFIVSVEIMKKLTPFTTNLALNLETVYAIALGFIIYGESEKMTVSFYIGGILILCLIVFNEVIKKRKIKFNKKNKQ